MRTIRGRKATNAFSRSRPLSTFNRISKWRTHKFRNATRQEEPGPRKRALVHRQSHGQGLSRGVAIIGQFSNRRQINMKELRNIRTSHSLYFLIHDQRGRSHGVAISKKVRWEKSSSPLASRPGTSSLRQRTSSRLGRIPAFYTRGVLREGGPRCWIGAGGGGGGGSQFAWFANLSAVRGAKVGWMEYLPLAATAMLVSPPHLGSIQGLMANLAQEYYLKIDKKMN